MLVLRIVKFVTINAQLVKHIPITAYHALDISVGIHQTVPVIRAIMMMVLRTAQLVIIHAQLVKHIPITAHHVTRAIIM
jgi:hypothetical protein